MRDKVLNVMAAAALLASVGVANAKDPNAKGPVELKDVQLDKVTAGATSANQTGSLLAASTATLNGLPGHSPVAVGLSNFTAGLLNGVPLTALPTVTP